MNTLCSEIIGRVWVGRLMVTCHWRALKANRIQWHSGQYPLTLEWVLPVLFEPICLFSITYLLITSFLSLCLTWLLSFLLQYSVMVQKLFSILHTPGSWLYPLGHKVPSPSLLICCSFPIFQITELLSAFLVHSSVDYLKQVFLFCFPPLWPLSPTF